jgi:uncharacterized protein with HEPN domain
MRTPRLLLTDILEAIDVVERYLPPTQEAFDSNPPVQSHIVRHIAIIGEAATQLPRAFRDSHPNIPLRQISDMRNIVVHVYRGINWGRVYQTATADVPVLRPQIQAILAALPPDAANP